MKINQIFSRAVSRRAVLTGGAIAAASLAIPHPALGATDPAARSSSPPTTSPSMDELSPTHREFLLLWILLTQGASSYNNYSAAAGNTAKQILDAITGDVRNELQNNAWYWPNLCAGLAVQYRGIARDPNMPNNPYDPAFNLVNDVCGTQTKHQADGHGVYYWIEKEDLGPNNPPWPGNAPHPGIHAIVTALGVH